MSAADFAPIIQAIIAGIALIITTLIGIAGSFLATWAGQQMGWYGPEQPAGFIASVVGAIVLLLLDVL